MQYGNVPGVDKQISRLVQGIIQVNSKDEAEGFALLDAVWEQNINAFDTARVYGDKDAFLGKWLNARGLRDEAVVIAKGAHHSGLRKRVTPYDIGSDLHDTLAAMQTSYVDVSCSTATTPSTRSSRSWTP
jgi:aryl-alcohol dehydrogenase-like predicted oxidoreductase